MMGLDYSIEFTNIVVLALESAFACLLPPFLLSPFSFMFSFVNFNSRDLFEIKPVQPLSLHNFLSVPGLQQRSPSQNKTSQRKVCKKHHQI